MDGQLTMSSMFQLLTLLLATVTPCPVIDKRCFCHHADTPGSIRQQFVTCSDMGALGQIPAFDVSYEPTEMLLFSNNTTVSRLQSHAFAHVKVRRLTLRGLEITAVDHLAFGGLEETVISIDLGDNKISDVPYDTFFRLTLLSTLRLDGNRIAALDQGTLHGMTRLHLVDLGNNRLRSLPSVLFRDLIDVRVLRLQGNGAATIREGQFSNLRNLEELDLADNRLSTVPSDTFAAVAKLRRLNLSGNKISGVLTSSSFLLRLGNLTELNVSRNHISALSWDAFRGCRQLVVVDLSRNGLRHLQHDSQCCDITASIRCWCQPSENTSAVDVSGNERSTATSTAPKHPAFSLGNSFDASNRLERLDLSANLIESIPDDFLNANSSLEMLDLSDNILVDVGRFLLNASRLRRLDLSKNYLSHLPLSAFANLMNLVYLDVSRNHLKGQIDGHLIWLLPQLEMFMVDGNNVTCVEFKGPSVQLVRLTMSCNSLNGLPRLFHAPELEVLDVADNQIGAIGDDSFACCKSLRQLRLARNGIASVSVGAFRGLVRLTEIDLSDNRLSYLFPRLFESCPALYVVNLFRNRLAELDGGTLAGPRNLHELDLSWNRLTTLTVESIRGVFLTLVRLSLSGNPLRCDCDVAWLSTYTALVDRSTTICCPEDEFGPAVCRYVVCESSATCRTVNAANLPVSIANSSLCERPVPASLIVAVFHRQTTQSLSAHPMQVTTSQYSPVLCPVLDSKHK